MAKILQQLKPVKVNDEFATMSGKGQSRRQWVISGVAGRKEMHLTQRSL